MKNVLLKKKINTISSTLFGRKWFEISFTDGTQVKLSLRQVRNAVKAKRISDENIGKILIMLEPCPVRF